MGFPFFRNKFDGCGGCGFGGFGGFFGGFEGCGCGFERECGCKKEREVKCITAIRACKFEDEGRRGCGGWW